MSKFIRYFQTYYKGIGTANRVQAWTGPEDCRRLRIPYLRQLEHEGDKIVSSTHRPYLPPRKYSLCSFLLQAESTPGP